MIRATLVPAFRKLAGEANWWAPGWMRWIHERIGFSESEPLPVDEVPAAHATGESASADVTSSDGTRSSADADADAHNHTDHEHDHPAHGEDPTCIPVSTTSR